MENYFLKSTYTKDDNVILIDDDVDASKLNIEIKGRGNSIKIESGSKINDTFIRFWGNGNKVKIGNQTKICGRFLFDGNQQLLDIGDNTTFERVNIVIAEETSVVIGKDCMLSFGIQIRTTDAHSVIDTLTNKRTNHAGNIKIKDHVWIGSEVIIQKGSEIPNNSIVGIRSVVSGKFTNSNIAVAGVPARIIKENIDWDRKLLKD